MPPIKYKSPRIDSEQLSSAAKAERPEEVQEAFQQIVDSLEDIAPDEFDKINGRCNDYRTLLAWASGGKEPCRTVSALIPVLDAIARDTSVHTSIDYIFAGGRNGFPFTLEENEIPMFTKAIHDLDFVWTIYIRNISMRPEEDNRRFYENFNGWEKIVAIILYLGVKMKNSDPAMRDVNIGDWMQALTLNAALKG